MNDLLPWYDQVNWLKDPHLAYVKGLQDGGELGWKLGVHQERERIAAGHAELGKTWKPIGDLGYAHRVEARIALMEAAAAKNEGATWRGNYPGGPVDFETGQLIQPRIGAAA